MIKLSEYMYEDYLERYSRTGGRQSFFTPVIGTKTWHTQRLEEREFYKLRAQAVGNCFMGRLFFDQLWAGFFGPDELEGLAYEWHWLMRDLLLATEKVEVKV